tara:strand:- start:1020 stop:2858 length:1839 start_codon:yes stop_codon:yes gene_type:complete
MTKEELENLRAAAILNKQLLEDSEQRLRNVGSVAEQLERELKVEEETLKIIKLQKQLGQATLQDVKDQNQLIEERRRELERQEKIQERTDSLMGSIGEKLGLVNAKTKESVDFFIKMVDPLNASNKAVGRIVIGLSVAVNSLKSMVEATKNVVIEVDRVRAGFVGVTADTSDAMRMAERLTLSNLDLAISFGEMSKAQVNLRTQFAQFGFLSDSVRESITLQGAQLQKLGVDAGTTATIMNTLTMSFGQSASEAAATQRQIIGLGQALKIPPAVIARDFAQALPQLAQFGDQAVRVFEELSVAARQAGVSVSDLTGVFGDQFNTFEGAVGAAGRLNQALRSDVFSGMELLMADTAERQRMIKEGLRLSGVEFKNLERYEKLYIANALGIRDVAQAAAILGDSQEQVAMRIGDTSFSMAEMEEMTQAATASSDKLKFVFMQLAVAVTPLVDAFAKIVQGFLDFVEVVPGGMGTIVGVIGALGGIIGVMGAISLGGPVGAALATVSAIGGLTAGGLGLAAATGVGTEVGDASVSGADVSGIRTRGGGNMIPAADDTVVAAKEGGVLARELKEIKNAIKGMNGGMNGVKFVLEIDGRALETPVKRIIKDYSDGYV